MISAPLIVGYAAALRGELIERSRELAERSKVPHSFTHGEMPAVIFESYEGGRAHGNFIPASYRAIIADAAWRRRLTKVHTHLAKSRSPLRNTRACELDSCTSSDALLMNIFCHPRATKSVSLRAMLGLDENAAPEFGVRARVPLVGAKFDRTEVDLRFGDLLIEAKLTESDFQSKHKNYLESYRDLKDVFDLKLLPRKGEVYFGYQLIRNVLAAYAQDCSFCVLADARRPDLKEMWYSVLQAVKPVTLRLRSKMLTWQELAEVLPKDLQLFLVKKYGIVRAGQTEQLIVHRASARSPRIAAASARPSSGREAR